MRKLGWLTVVAMSGAVALVACSDEDSVGDTGGTAGSRDSGTDARDGGGTSTTGGGAGISTGGSGGTAAGAAGTGGSAGNGGAGTGGAGMGGAGTTRDAAPDTMTVTPEPQPEAGPPDAPPDVVSADADASVVTPEAAAPEAAAPEAAAPEAAAEAEAAPPEAVDAGSADEPAVDAEAEASADAAAEAGPAGPTVQYGFETGVQGWTTSAPSLALAVSTAQVDTGTQSLEITMTNADYSTVKVNNPPAGLSAGSYSLRVFVPATSTLTVLKPYDQIGAPSYDWVGLDNIPIQASGTWQTYTFQFPTTYSVDGASLPRNDPFYELGLQLRGNGPIYIDNVSW
jgi:hypothetical protein